MQQKQSSSRFLTKKKVLIFSCILLLALVFVGVFLFRQYFTVQTIVVDKGSYQGEIHGITSLKNESMIFTKNDDLRKYLFALNPAVKDVIINKEYPSTLLLSFQFNSPLAYLKASTGYMLLSNDSRVLRKTKELEKQFPIIEYYQAINYNSFDSGDVIDYNDIKRSLLFLKKAVDLGLSIDSVDISSFHMIALNTGDRRLLFTLEKKQEDQEYQFERVIQQLKVEGKSYKTLDFRFDRVILENEL